MVIGATISIASRIRGIGHEATVLCPMQFGAVRNVSWNAQKCRVRGGVREAFGVVGFPFAKVGINMMPRSAAEYKHGKGVGREVYNF